MSPILFHEFREIVSQASTIITHSTAFCPPIILTREQAISAATAALGAGSTLKVETWYLTTEPQIILGAPEGRRLIP